MKIFIYFFILFIPVTLIISEDAIGKRRDQISPSSLPITTIHPRHTFEDLTVRPETLKHLKNLMHQVAKQATSQAVIFAGPDHKGKLAAAEAIALELKRPLLKIDVKRLVSRYIGETEKNIDSVFRRAETQGAILFFDEADALFGKRTEVFDAHDKYANQEVSYLLQHIKQYPGLMIINTKDIPQRRTSQITTHQSIIVFPCQQPQDCTHN